MKSSIASLAGVVATVCLGFASQVHAAARITEPALDLKADLLNYTNNGNGIPTSSTWITIWGSNYAPPTWGAPATIYPYPPFPTGQSAPHGFAINTFNDIIILQNGGGFTNTSTARYAAAASYIAYDDGSLPGDAMTLTTVYGVDNAPSAPTLSLSGYNAADIIPLLSDEQVSGPSGTAYSASSGQLVPISALPAILGAGADLSIFSGDPNAPVWVFQTSMPFGETVPEPASLALVALAATTLTAGRNRGRAKNG